MAEERDQARESFCKVIRVKESLFTCMIPSGFISRSVPELGSEAMLETRDGSTWKVGVVKLCGESLIERGWREFCMENKVEVEDVAWFELVDGSRFRVRLYDSEGTEKLKVAEGEVGRVKVGKTSYAVPAVAPPVTPETKEKGGAEVVNDSGTENVESGVHVVDASDEKKGRCRRRKKTQVVRRLCKQVDDDQKDVDWLPKKRKTEQLERNVKVDDGIAGRKKRKNNGNYSSSSGESSSSARHKSKTVRGLITSAPSALAAAREFRSENPFAVIPLMKSCLAPSFLLNLPKDFASAWNSKERNVILLGDKERKFPVRYIEKRAISAGWVGFAKAHKIDPRDCIVMEAIDASTLRCRVYRGADSKEA